MIKTPFLPMRPTPAERLTPDNILAVVGEYRARGWIEQRKLNGDSGTLESTKDGLKLWNRYGSIYAASGVKLNPWLGLPVGSILGGEIYQGEFRCFEVIQHLTEPLETASQRIAFAYPLCQQYSQPYIFGNVTNDWLMGEVTLKANPKTRMFEGLVWRLASAKYTPMKQPHHECPTIYKTKWS